MTNYKILCNNRVSRDISNQNKNITKERSVKIREGYRYVESTKGCTVNRKGPEAVPNTLTPEIFSQYLPTLL